MSIESAQKFLQRVKNDKSFKEEFAGLDVEKRGSFLLSAGFQFSKEELEQALGELGDKELEQISGGGSCTVLDSALCQAVYKCSNVTCDAQCEFEMGAQKVKGLHCGYVSESHCGTETNDNHCVNYEAAPGPPIS